MYDFGGDDLNDSVFLSQHHRSPPNLSPFQATPMRQVSSKVSPSDKEQLTNHHPTHFNRYIHFEPNHDAGSSSKKSSEKIINSPNLSPIRQTVESSNCTLKVVGSNNRTLGSSATRYVSKEEASLSRSIIFMDVGDNDLSRADFSKPNDPNLSFVEPANEFHYRQNSFVEMKAGKFEENEELENFTFRNSLPKQNDKLFEENLESTKAAVKKLAEQMNISKPLLTTMNSIIETTSTFNQDSQDTGYQTNSANCGNASYNPSMMCMDTTGNNEMSSNCLNFISLNKLSGDILQIRPKKTESVEHVEECDNALKPIDNNRNTSGKRPLNLDLKNALIVLSRKSANKIRTKKTSVSLNSLENIQPVG